MLELSDRKFKIAIMNSLRFLKKKVNKSKKIWAMYVLRYKTLRNNQMDVVETLTEMKSAFNKLISRFDKAKERITKPKDRSIETF